MGEGFSYLALSFVWRCWPRVVQLSYVLYLGIINIHWIIFEFRVKKLPLYRSFFVTLVTRDRPIKKYPSHIPRFNHKGLPSPKSNCNPSHPFTSLYHSTTHPYTRTPQDRNQTLISPSPTLSKTWFHPLSPSPHRIPSSRIPYPTRQLVGLSTHLPQRQFRALTST